MAISIWSFSGRSFSPSRSESGFGLPLRLCIHERVRYINGARSLVPYISTLSRPLPSERGARAALAQINVEAGSLVHLAASGFHVRPDRLALKPALLRAVGRLRRSPHGLHLRSVFDDLLESREC